MSFNWDRLQQGIGRVAARRGRRGGATQEWGTRGRLGARLKRAWRPGRQG